MSDFGPCTHEEALAEIERLDVEVAKLRAALEPFARNVDALYLSKALGHIEREHLLKARAALNEQKP